MCSFRQVTSFENCPYQSDIRKAVDRLLNIWILNILWFPVLKWINEYTFIKSCCVTRHFAFPISNRVWFFSQSTRQRPLLAIPRENRAKLWELKELDQPHGVKVDWKKNWNINFFVAPLPDHAFNLILTSLIRLYRKTTEDTTMRVKRIIEDTTIKWYKQKLKVIDETTNEYYVEVICLT